MNRRWSLALITVAAIALGALHEWCFVNLNYQLDHVRRTTEFSYAHSRFQHWTVGWTTTDLSRLKWGMALFFIGCMLGLTLIFARVLFGHRRYVMHIAAGYATIGILALLLHVLAGWSAPLEVVSVKLLHLLQFPVVLIFLWAAASLSRTK